MGWVAVVAVAVFVVMGITLTVLRRRGRSDEEHGSVALDFATNLALAIYLLVLAYAAVLCRDAINAANTDVAAEAESLTELYWSVSSIPEAGPVREKIKSYTEQSITLDWPLMTQDRLSDVADRSLDELRAGLFQLRPADETHREMRQEALARAAEVSHARGIRAADASTRLEGIFLISMVISGIAVIVLPWTRGIRPTVTSVVSDVVRLAIVVTGIVFIQLLSHPFSGVGAVEPSALQTAQQQFDRIDDQILTSPGG
ncbi:hypothetical protein Misp01_63220 [Microtetraspora sp. NBRC 13810]|uniref:bestrophin-like domain n=1 Tax=Microtetraspora sp. NBRC 13810 TaxID=3030990 RepID=UPI0024A009D4|nr:DUF4239 domain-containing protein [Microtetraspora sp. NBRC 13810]GLW11194.1 hypothetical protein Misp01_63220 [Microtetraspora sp. NBRC 13810]